MKNITTIVSTTQTVLLAAGLAAAVASPAVAQTEFTYQGVLSALGAPVDGPESIRFRLYDAPVDGTLIGETTQNVDVLGGVFTAPINLGPLNTIDPSEAWLEVAVNTGPGTFEVLGRQKITAVIGPTISQPNYEVGPDLRDQFINVDPCYERFFVAGSGDRYQFDLPAFGLAQLQSCGIVNAHWTRHCTYADQNRFFSYRRSVHQKEADYGRLISAICLKKGP